MHYQQQTYRQLFEGILHYTGPCLFEHILVPWIRDAGEEQAWLRELMRRAHPTYDMPIEENWRLYALSRIVDLLTVSFTPVRDAASDGWHVMPVTHDQFVAFMTELGAEPVPTTRFTPFHHELVRVDSTTSAEIRIEAVLWPGFKFGPLLMSRAGCAVSAPPASMKPEVASASTLYWAYARNNRPAEDLSHGWGSNSHWRTRFRLDYEVDRRRYYNVGAELDPEDDPEPTLTKDEQRELLLHRCFVRCEKPHEHLWPYDWTLAESDDP